MVRAVTAELGGSTPPPVWAGASVAAAGAAAAAVLRHAAGRPGAVGPADGAAATATPPHPLSSGDGGARAGAAIPTARVDVAPLPRVEGREVRMVVMKSPLTDAFFTGEEVWTALLLVPTH
jgi:hypothetical protein